jgi:succinate dehydrogenase/fumarate reductase flavoprotein subunit
MHSNKSLNFETLAAQTVVIGGGGAGLCAAVAAVEKGANLDKLYTQNIEVVTLQ